MPEGFPDAASTGVRDGTQLKVVNGLTVTQDGADISGLEIHGPVTIEANNVHIHDCKIVNDSGTYYAIRVTDPLTYKGTVVDHNDIIGGINGIAGGGEFAFNDIEKTDNGINVWATANIHDNYIYLTTGSSEAHFDGIELNGGGNAASNTVIQHNTIINTDTQTSAVMINNEFGTGSHLVVDHNYLAGGGYTVYLDNNKDPAHPITDMQVTNNVIGKGYYGYYYQTDDNMHVSGNQEIGTAWPTPSSGGTTPTPTAASAPTPSQGSATDTGGSHTTTGSSSAPAAADTTSSTASPSGTGHATDAGGSHTTTGHSSAPATTGSTAPASTGANAPTTTTGETSTTDTGSSSTHTHASGGHNWSHTSAPSASTTDTAASQPSTSGTSSASQGAGTHTGTTDQASATPTGSTHPAASDTTTASQGHHTASWWGNVDAFSFQPSSSTADTHTTGQTAFHWGSQEAGSLLDQIRAFVSAHQDTTTVPHAPLDASHSGADVHTKLASAAHDFHL